MSESEHQQENVESPVAPAEVSQKNLITAEELAKMLRISPATLYRQLKDGPPQKTSGGTSIDVRTIPDFYIGGRRFFNRSAVEKLLASA